MASSPDGECVVAPPSAKAATNQTKLPALKNVWKSGIRDLSTGNCTAASIAAPATSARITAMVVNTVVATAPQEAIAQLHGQPEKAVADRATDQGQVPARAKPQWRDQRSDHDRRDDRAIGN